MMTVTFDKKLAELDAYLQMLIEQNENLDKKIDLVSVGPEKDGLLSIKHNLESLLGSIKHAIVLLQIAKVSIKSSSPEQQQQQQKQTTQSYSTDSLSSSITSITDKNSSPQGAITATIPQGEQQISSPKPPARSSKRHSQQLPSNTRHFPSPQLSSSLLAQPSDTPSISSPTGQQQHSNSGSSNISSSISNSGKSNSGSIRQLQQAEQRERFDSSGESNLPHRIRDDNAEVSSKVPPQSYIKSKIVDTRRGVKDGAPGATSLENSGADYDDDDDDTFYDAADEHNHLHQQQKQHQQNENLLLSQPSDPNQSSANNISILNTSMEPNNNNNNPIEDVSINWDALYEEEEEDLGSLENQGSVIKHLMSQIRIGMDLTKVVLPTFILERRSLLEMYADFFAHPDLFSSIPDYDTPEERMIQLVKWYLSAFHAGRKSSVAKKPYNPILGEIFLCHWNTDNDNSNQPCNNNNSNSNNSQNKQTNVSESNDNLQSNNIERMNSTESSSSVSDIEKFSNQLPEDSLLFVAEQVSHHPPVSAFYAENRKKLISCCAHIYTKSKYLGLSVGVHNIGQGVIRLLKHNETYVCTFPSAYGRSILTVPWVELGGSVNITCEQTGYSAGIEFVTKPFYGGKKHRVIGEILRPNKEPFMTIDGEWNGVMYSKTIPNSNEKQVFVDTTCLPVIHKHVRSISNQETFESRNVWKEVTRALKLRDVVSATAAKSFIEQRQRDLLKDRMEKGIKWRTRYFETVDDGWAYAKPLTFISSNENDDKEK